MAGERMSAEHSADHQKALEFLAFVFHQPERVTRLISSLHQPTQSPLTMPDEPGSFTYWMGNSESFPITYSYWQKKNKSFTCLPAPLLSFSFDGSPSPQYTACSLFLVPGSVFGRTLRDRHSTPNISCYQETHEIWIANLWEKDRLNILEAQISLKKHCLHRRLKQTPSVQRWPMTLYLLLPKAAVTQTDIMLVQKERWKGRKSHMC